MAEKHATEKGGIGDWVSTGKLDIFFAELFQRDLKWVREGLNGKKAIKAAGLIPKRRGLDKVRPNGKG